MFHIFQVFCIITFLIFKVQSEFVYLNQANLDNLNNTKNNETDNCVKYDKKGDCEECDKGYYLNNTSLECNKCNMDHCVQCSNATVCTKCDNISLLATTGNCELCQDVIEGCISCNSRLKCDKCASKRFFDPYSIECTLCPRGCKECLNKNYCTSCLPLYEKNIRNTCHLTEKSIKIIEAVIFLLIFPFLVFFGCLIYNFNKRRKSLKSRKSSGLSNQFSSLINENK